MPSPAKGGTPGVDQRDRTGSTSSTSSARSASSWTIINNPLTENENPAPGSPHSVSSSIDAEIVDEVQILPTDAVELGEEVAEEAEEEDESDDLLNDTLGVEQGRLSDAASDEEDDDDDDDNGSECDDEDDDDEEGDSEVETQDEQQHEEGEEYLVDDDDLSVVDHNEAIDPDNQLYVDPSEVARLFDVLGTTHSWLKRHRLAKVQLHQLKTLQNELVSCLEKMDNKEQRRCHASERPGLPYRVPFHSRATKCASCPSAPGCANDLARCQQDLAEVKSDFWRKSAINRYIHVTNQQQQPQGTSELSANQQTLVRDMVQSARRNQSNLVWRAKVRTLRMQRRLDTLQRKLSLQEEQLNAERASTQRVLAGDAMLHIQLARATEGRKRAYDLLSESETNLRNIEENISQCRRDLRNATSYQQWSIKGEYYVLMDRVRQSTNATDALAAFYSLVNMVQMPELAESTEKAVKDQMRQVYQLLDELRASALSQLVDVQHKDSARKAVQQFFDTFKLPQSLYNTFSYAINESDQKYLPAVIKSGWTALSTRLQSTFDEFLKIPDMTEDEEEAGSPSSTAHVCHALNALAGALEAAELQDIVGKTASRSFIDGRLRRFPCTSPIRGTDLHFLECQKCWWTDVCDQLANPTRCEWEGWQRSKRLDRDRFLNDRPEVATVMRERLQWPAKSVCIIVGLQKGEATGFCRGPTVPVAPKPTQQHQTQDGSWLATRAKTRQDLRESERETDWVFDRSRARDERRQLDRAGYERTDWMFKRGKSRAEQRNSDAIIVHSGEPASKKRRGEGRSSEPLPPVASHHCAHSDHDDDDDYRCEFEFDGYFERKDEQKKYRLHSNYKAKEKRSHQTGHTNSHHHHHHHHHHHRQQQQQQQQQQKHQQQQRKHQHRHAYHEYEFGNAFVEW